MTDDPRIWYSTVEVAKALGRTPGAIRRWIYAEKVPASQVGDKGEWRIPAWWLQQQLGKTPTEAPKLPRRRFVTLPAGEK